jgi:hypothetical protein
MARCGGSMRSSTQLGERCSTTCVSVIHSRINDHTTRMALAWGICFSAQFRFMLADIYGACVPCVDPPEQAAV